MRRSCIFVQLRVSLVVLCALVILVGCSESDDSSAQSPKNAPNSIPTGRVGERLGNNFEFSELRRRALIIGNGDYLDSALDLDNAENDARLMRRALTKIGFETSMVLNPTADEATYRLLSFLEESRESDFNLIYYAGHGFQINGENYLVPADFEVLPLARGEISGMVRMSTVVDAIQRSGASKTIVIMDACRDNPLEQIDAENGLAFPPPIPKESSAEILFVYAAAPGRKALDSIREGDRNSPFTKSLAGWLTDKRLTFESVVQATIRDVSSETLGYQVPWQSSNFSAPVRLAAYKNPTPILLNNVPVELSGDGKLELQPDIWSMIDKNADDSRKDTEWKGGDDLRYVAVADSGDRANVLTCQGDGRRCDHQTIAADAVYRCEERSDKDCGLYAVILNGDLRRLWRGPVTRLRGSRTEGLSIAINLKWQQVGQVTGSVDYNTEGLGAIELLMVETGMRCAGAYRFERGLRAGRFNGSCGDGTKFTGTFSRNSRQTFYAEGSDSRGRSFNGLFSTFR